MIPTIDVVRLDSAAALTLETGYSMGWDPFGDMFLTKLDGWTGSAPIVRSKAGLLTGHGTHGERGRKDERLVSASGHAVFPSRAEAAHFSEEVAAFLGDGLAGTFRVVDRDLGPRTARVYLAPGAVDVKWTGGVDVAFTVHMLAPDPRKYGDPETSGPTGIPVPGGGLVFPLFSRSAATSAVTRTNLALNPAGTSTANWSNIGPAPHTRAVDSAIFRSGGSAIRTTLTGSGALGTKGTVSGGIAANETVSWSLWVYPSVACSFQPYWERITPSYAGGAGGGLVACPANTWTEIRGTNTFSAAQADPSGTFGFGFYYGSNAFVANDFFVADELIVRKDALGSLGAYFDGASPAVAVDSDTSRTYSWSGGANASASLETTIEHAGPSGVLEIGAGGYSGKVSATNRGRADTGLLFTVTGDYVPGFTITSHSGRRLVYGQTVNTGQVLTLDSNNGQVKLDGYAQRATELTAAEWERLDGGESGTWLFESPGSVNAALTVTVAPAWW